MFTVTHSYDLKGEEFKVSLSPIDNQEVEYYAQLSKEYDYLKDVDTAFMLSVLSKGIESDIIVLPNTVEETIDNSIQSLVDQEQYEYCIVLKKVKEDYIKYHKNNDNK